MAEQRIITCDWCGEVIQSHYGDGWYHVEECNTMKQMHQMINSRGPFDYCSPKHLAEHAQTGFRPRKRQAQTA